MIDNPSFEESDLDIWEKWSLCAGEGLAADEGVMMAGNKDGIPDMCTEDAVGVVGDNLAEISDTLKLMRRALRKPILNYADFGPGGKYYADLLGDVTCAKCGERINRCECEDGFFFKEEEQGDA